MARSQLNIYKVLLSALAALLIGGCATPTSELRAAAANRGFERTMVNGAGFELTVFENQQLLERSRGPVDEPTVVAIPGDSFEVPPSERSSLTMLGAASTKRDDVLHVYLEGDGRPWTYRVIVTPDPTPRRPMMLGMMALDDAPAIYVGRPCYNGSSRDAGCNDSLWTSARYSSRVIESMSEVISNHAERHGFTRLRLFGHSGGGTLAWLLAARLEKATDVVTIAGNLDTDAWTRHHGYTPLWESLNPAREQAMPLRVSQWHLLGGQDQVVPPEVVRPFIDRARRTTAVLYPSFSHGCCWSRVWPGVLRALDRGDSRLLPGRVFRQVGE